LPLCGLKNLHGINLVNPSGIERQAYRLPKIAFLGSAVLSKKNIETLHSSTHCVFHSSLFTAFIAAVIMLLLCCFPLLLLAVISDSKIQKHPLNQYNMKREK
jgi:hypothetical protein